MIENPLPEDYKVEIKPTVKSGGDPVYGYCDYDKEKIALAVKPGDLLNTIIHEKLHANYPTMSHEDVYKNADKIEGSMTLPQMAQELLQIHERSLNPPYKREIVHTEYSNIISRKVN